VKTKIKGIMKITNSDNNLLINRLYIFIGDKNKPGSVFQYFSRNKFFPKVGNKLTKTTINIPDRMNNI
jgi:hypothetical protein